MAVTPAALHEQHKARVLGAARAAILEQGRALDASRQAARAADPDSARQHHDEATDALIVEALQSAQQRIRCQRVTGCPDPVDGYTCPSCWSLGKIDAALRVMAR